MSNTIFVSGFPGEIGGANTECWHTVKLWRRGGLDVTLIPTWRASRPVTEKLEAIGCRVVESNPDDLENVAGLAGSIVVSFCNGEFLRHAARFRDLGCRVVWVGCMNRIAPLEAKHYVQFGRTFDRYVFQSAHQWILLAELLRRYGLTPEQDWLIPGAFDVDEFPFRPRPHAEDGPFIVGRISRPDLHKFSRHTWEIVRKLAPPVEFRILGWHRRLNRKLGEPPENVTTHVAGSVRPQDFLGGLHCLLQAGNTAENWPRVGLEAMAAGVPIIADNGAGWANMLESSRTGFLADEPDDFAGFCNRLARCEPLRIEILTAARAAVERIADPDRIFSRWKDLFDGL